MPAPTTPYDDVDPLVVPVCLAVAGVSGVAAAARSLTLPADLAGPLSARGVGALAVLVAVAVLWRRRPGVLPAQTVLAGVVLVAVTGGLLDMTITGAPRHTTDVALAVVGAGAVLLTARLLAATLAATWLAWTVTASWLAATGHASAGEWVHHGLLLAGATLLGVSLRTLRVGALGDLRVAQEAAAAATVRDPLTALSNRHGLTLLGTQVVETARRQGDAVHCLFLDVDGLKRVNDELGHHVGDDVLVAVADALRGSTRATDVVARWGGDEFVVIGPGTGTPPVEMERRVRARLVERSIAPAHIWAARVSVGSAVLEPWDDGSLELMLSRADQEMHLRRALRREASGPVYRPPLIDPSDTKPTARYPRAAEQDPT